MNIYAVILNSLLIFGIIQICSTKGFGNKNDGDVDDKYRVCVVESRGAYKKVASHCPTLEAKTNIQCVVGADRLDCLRRIHKGSAHFGVFSSEELVAARWAGVEILVTHELRFHDTPFEYEVVAIVDNEAGINSAQDLSGKRFCHPGHGLQSHWTEILANYFESTLVPRQCESDLTLTESRLKASSKFFGPSCKAGPWVPDPVQDRNLKAKYPSLCQLCDNPYQCGISDKHWGRQGSLYCLTSGNGEVSWARLDDVKSHFGFSGLPKQAEPDGFSLLCMDGHLQPLNTSHPCVWVAKPWPAVAAKRSSAAKVQQYLENLSHNDQDSWENALLSVLETIYSRVTPLDNAIPIDDYLDQASGFQSAYSFAGCNPPRSILYCTTSLIQHNKCSWLQEAASVYGIEPNLQCIRTESLERCMDDTKHKVADVVLVDPDSRIRAERDYHLKPILYEYSPKINDRYTIIAVTNEKSDIKNFSELRGKRACFPSYEGAAYLSVMETLQHLLLAKEECKYSREIKDFFSHDSCTWESKNRGNCDKSYRGDVGALKCLADGYGDVAFINSDLFKNFTEGGLMTPWSIKFRKEKLKLICPSNKSKKTNENCYLNWIPRGHLMIHNETKLIRRNEIYNSLREMDRLFGKHYKSQTIPFTMFGPFDRKNNVMFHDVTDSLKGITELMKDKIERNLESTYVKYLSSNCKLYFNSGMKINSFNLVSLILISFVTIFYY